jgi:hypothetical protein
VDQTPTKLNTKNIVIGVVLFGVGFAAGYTLCNVNSAATKTQNIENSPFSWLWSLI